MKPVTMYLDMETWENENMGEWKYGRVGATILEPILYMGTYTTICCTARPARSWANENMKHGFIE